jgi:hypothetical protein
MRLHKIKIGVQKRGGFKRQNKVRDIKQKRKGSTNNEKNQKRKKHGKLGLFEQRTIKNKLAESKQHGAVADDKP